MDIEQIIENYVTLDEAAKMLGYTRGTVRTLAYKGRLRAISTPLGFLISRESIERYQRRPRGRPENLVNRRSYDYPEVWENYVTSVEAAKLLGCSRQNIHQVARRQGWKVYKLNYFVLFRKSDVEQYKPAKRGRPRKVLTEQPA
jgi:excisionase family DNA binding protein